MKTRSANRKLWLHSVGFGFVIALIVTLVVTIWEWIENPSDIFHGSEGTHWSIVWETAMSWFIPTFLYVTATCLGIIILCKLLRRVYRTFTKRSI